MYSSLIITSLFSFSSLLSLAHCYPSVSSGVQENQQLKRQPEIPSEPRKRNANSVYWPKIAKGALPNGSLPISGVSSDTIASLQLLAFNENFEWNFFSSLFENITDGSEGYNLGETYGSAYASKMTDFIANIMSQEFLHSQNVNAVLKSLAGGDDSAVVSPCKYYYGATTWEQAISVASTFTDVVLGTLQDITTGLAVNGDSGLIGTITSVLGQEGEQQGFFRQDRNHYPASTPFLTGSTRLLAWSAFTQNFLIPSSCSNNTQVSVVSSAIGTPLPALTIVSSPSTSSLSASFSIVNSSLPASLGYITYINQQLLPITVPITNCSGNGTNGTTGGVITFNAEFPFVSGGFGNGLSLALLTTQPQGNGFNSTKAAVEAAAYGPGLIEVFDEPEQS